jgi:hypothetical protein
MLILLFITTVLLDDEQRRAVAARVREALRLADVGIGKAALYMGMGPQDFEKCLNAERPLNVWRLELLPREFHRNYHMLALLADGLPERIDHAIKMGLPQLMSLKESA